MLSTARRLSMPCALMGLVAALTAPTFAQIAAERAETTRSMAPITAAMLAEEWLGPRPHHDFDGTIRGTLWQGRGAMAVEQQLAERAIRGWWPGQIVDAHADAILDGFSRYLQTRSTERLFDAFFLRTAHRFESKRYLGDHVIWSFPPLRLSRHTAAKHDRYAAVFDALEQWIGTPALQSAMFEVAHLPADRLTADDIMNTISTAVGEDVSWAFDAAITDVNYAVDAISEKSVTVSRRGAGMFTGRAAPRIGEFESGDALRLHVVFANGSSTFVHWDGRDQTKAFTFEAPSSIVAAYLDPDRIVTLDSNRLDNAIVSPKPTNVPVRKWVARWMVWLQHTMLSYGFLA